MKKECGRIQYLDLVKLFTIYLVILGHVIAMMVNGYAVGERLYAIIYSFHMPLFMLLSGYFISNKSLNKPFNDFLITKAKQLLLPTLTCTIICVIYIYFARNYVDLRTEIIGNSWFLKTLFVYYLIFHIVKHISLNDWLLMFVSCFLLFVIPYASTLQINLLFPYFWGGYMLRKYNILEKISFSWKYSFIFTLIFVVVYFFQRYYNIPNYIAIDVNSILLSGHLIVYRYIVGFSGCLATITIVSSIYHFYDRFGQNEGGLSKYGKWTLGVYVLQTVLIINIFPDTLAWEIKNPFLFNVIVAPSISILFLILCLFLINLLSKNKTLDLLLFGGQYYKK